VKVLRTLDKILGKISGACAWVSGAALFLMAVLIFADVFCRYFLKSSITGSQEVVQLMMVFVVYFALCQSTRIRAHVRVDFFTNMMPAYIRNVVLGIVTLLCIFVTANISIRTFSYAGQVWASRTSSPILKINYAPFYYIISVMNVLLSLEFLADGLKYFGEAAEAFRNRKNPPAPTDREEETV
jgi:TRAP-type C4-dicarboxylate transport system permease small subunit